MTNQVANMFGHVRLPSVILTPELVSAIFYRFFVFSPNDDPSKIIKNIFYFIVKALFVLVIFNFL